MMLYFPSFSFAYLKINKGNAHNLEKGYCTNPQIFQLFGPVLLFDYSDFFVSVKTFALVSNSRGLLSDMRNYLLPKLGFR